jgi:hypothetical protein
MLFIEQFTYFFRTIFDILYFRNVEKIENECYDNYDNYIVDDCDNVPTNVNIMRR